MPKEWLGSPITVQEAEADFANEEIAGRRWLSDWREMIDSMQPGDELCPYGSPRESWAYKAGRAGFAVVRNGIVVDAILTLMN